MPEHQLFWHRRSAGNLSENDGIRRGIEYPMKVNDHEITRGAREEAAQIIANAEAQAEELRRNAHIYVKSLLENVNETLTDNIAKIQTNLTEINSTLDETE